MLVTTKTATSSIPKKIISLRKSQAVKSDFSIIMIILRSENRVKHGYSEYLQTSIINSLYSYFITVHFTSIKRKACSGLGGDLFWYLTLSKSFTISKFARTVFYRSVITIIIMKQVIFIKKIIMSSTIPLSHLSK